MSSRRAFTKFGIYLLIALGFAIFYFLNFKTVVVHGQSMMPSLKNGQRILISKAYWLIGGIKRGDIIVMKDANPDGYIIKRVYRLEGEIVDYANAPDNYSLSSGEYKVPAGHYYILGDNRPESEDSRLFGPVEDFRIIGKVVARW